MEVFQSDARVDGAINIYNTHPRFFLYLFIENKRSSASNKLYLGSDQFAFNNEAITELPLEDVREASEQEEVTSFSPLATGGILFPFACETDEWFIRNIPFYTVEVKDLEGRYIQPYWLQNVNFQYFPYNLQTKYLMVEIVNRMTCHVDTSVLYRMSLCLYSNREEGLHDTLEELIIILNISPFQFDKSQISVQRLPKTKLKFCLSTIFAWGEPTIFNVIRFIDRNPGFLSILGMLLHTIVLELNLHQVHSQLNGNNGECTNDDDLNFDLFLKASWLYNLLLFIRYMVMNSHRLLYLLLSIAVKLHALKFSMLVVYNTIKIGLMIETNILAYMGTLLGYLQILILYNLINLFFDVEGDFSIFREVFSRNTRRRRGSEPIDEDDGRLNQLNMRHLVRVVGAGKGKKLISKKVKNSGTGGKSKLKKAPESIQEVLSNDENGDNECDYKNFVYSDFPKLRTRFKVTEINANANFVNFDCHGAPFCGVVCIDIAVGKKPKIEDYISRASACENPTDLGTNEFLAEYANFRGVNLAIMTSNNGNNVIHRIVNSPNWEYICLKFNEPDGGEIGHWTLLCSNDKNIVTGKREDPLEMLGVRINMPREIRLNQYLYGLIKFSYCFFVTEIFVDYDQEDKREVTHRRDPSEMEDCYFKINSDYYFSIVGFGVNIRFTESPITDCLNHVRQFFDMLEARFLILNANLPAYLQLNFVIYGHNTIIYLISVFILDHVVGRFSEQADNYYSFLYSEFLPKRDCVISFQKFKKAYLEAQTLTYDNRFMALSLISQSRYLNSNMQIPLILSNTMGFTRALITGLPFTSPNYQVRHVAVNAGNANAVIANQAVIAQNQQAGLAAVGAGKLSRNNFVKKAKIRKVVVNRVVAQSPTISFVNHGKQLGPGQICVTDDLGLLAAFCGRSMSKNPSEINAKTMKDFVKFSKRFIDRVIESMDFSKINQEDPRVAIARLYKGKKPEKFVSSLVEGYTKYLEGKSSRNYHKPSCFNKMENSAKIVDSVVRTKPRLIMVMSELMLIEYSQVLDVISVWNESFIKRFQIKHESEEDVVRKIIEVTSKDHMVTDYSSFECSIIGKIREIENYCIIKCLRRAGLTIALKRFTKDFSRPRVLENKEMHFHIDSRNSGDFHTSWMNGLVNILIGAYTYAKNNPQDKGFVNFNMIAEGDDGLRRSFGDDEAIAKQLGFGFSMSTCGTSPGDVDFLRARWINNKRYLNVARCLKIAWTLSGKTIGRTKSKQIQRCAALSMHALSPGHPILWALVKRIMLETKPNVLSDKMKEYFKHMSYNNSVLTFEELKIKCAETMGDFKCDEEMRKYVAMGAADFPPISIAQQLSLESMILDRRSNVINLIGILDDYEDIKVYSESEDWKINKNYTLVLSPEMEKLINDVGAKLMRNLKLIDDAKLAEKYELKFSE